VSSGCSFCVFICSMYMRRRKTSSWLVKLRELIRQPGVRGYRSAVPLLARGRSDQEPGLRHVANKKDSLRCSYQSLFHFDCSIHGDCGNMQGIVDRIISVQMYCDRGLLRDDTHKHTSPWLDGETKRIASTIWLYVANTVQGYQSTLGNCL